MENVFPKRIYAVEKGGWAQSPLLALMIVKRLREKPEEWHGIFMHVT